MRIKIFLTILMIAISISTVANAIDQSTVDRMTFLLNQPEWNEWGNGVFDNQTLYDGLEAVLDRAISEGDDILTGKIIWAMGETGIAEFSATIIMMLPEQPLTGSFALGKIPSEEGTYALIGMLDNDDDQVRAAASWGLAKLPYQDDFDTATRSDALAALKSHLGVEEEDWVVSRMQAAIAYMETGAIIESAFSDTEE
jgi:hypothetical protein